MKNLDKFGLGRRSFSLGAGIATLASLYSSREGLADYIPNPSAEKISLPKVTRGYARGPYGQVHYHDGGEGQPLVLIHQAPMSARQFDSVYDLFTGKGLRPIGIDMPGFGMSDPTTFVPRVEDWAKVVPSVLDHLGIESANILGHHTGALVATEVEQQFRGRVRKLILAGPLPLSAEKRAQYLNFVQRSEIDFEHLDDGSHLSSAFLVRHGAYQAGGSAPDPKIITRYTVEKFMGYGPFWYGHHAAFIYDHNQSIRKIQRPTLIMTNTGDQIYENAKLTKQMRPDFAFVELQGGGIDIMDQQPGAWVDAISEFIFE